jgi:hexosaminidase
MGHIAAQWNDYGYNTSTYLEAYYSWRNLLPALADKQWGGNLQDGDYDALFATLQPAAPGQNLDRDVVSKSSLILRYIFSPKPRPWSWGQRDVIKDLSGNHYDGKTNCSVVKGAMQFTDGCSVTTPLTSKGHGYTLSFTLKQTSSTPGPLFSGPDSELRSGNGTFSKVMLVSAGNAFPLNYSLRVGEWVDASLIARGNRTFFAVDGGSEMEFMAKIGINGESFAWVNMAVVAPLETIGGGNWEGEMKGVKLVDYA